MGETRAPVLDPGADKTKTGYLWALTRDERGWNGCDPPAVVVTYAPPSRRKHAFAEKEARWQPCDGHSLGL